METRTDSGSEETSVLRRARPLVLARLLMAVLAVSIPLVLARKLQLAEYGTYKQLFLIIQTLSYVLPFGFPQSVYFFAPRAQHRRPFFAHSLLFVTGGGLVAALAVWSLNGPLARYLSNPALLEFRAPLALYLLFLMCGKPLEMALTSQGRITAASLAYLVTDALRAVAMVVPVLLGFGLKGMMAAVTGLAVLRCAAAWVIVLKGTTGAFLDGKLFAQQLAYAIPFGAAMALAVPQQYAHQYVVSGMLSPEAFALYAVGCFQLPLVDLLYTPTSEVLMVRLGELEKTGNFGAAAQSFRQAVVELCRLFFPLSAFLMAAAPDFIGALFGPRFLPAVPVFRVSALGSALAVLPLDAVLRGRGETRHILHSYLVKALVTLPLVYLGVRWFGLLGGIGSWAIAEIIGKGFLCLRLRRALSPPGSSVAYRDILPWQELVRALVAAGSTAAAVLVIRSLTPQVWQRFPHEHLWRFIPLAMMAGLFTAGYLLALRLGGVQASALLASLRPRRAP